jgi:hypothetical protein
MSSNAIEKHPDERRRNLLLWISMLGAPVIWLIHLESGYALVQYACVSGRHFVLHLNAIVSLALVLGIGALAIHHWNQAGRGWPSQDEGGSTARWRTLSIMGVLQSGLFSLLILVAWAAIFILHPCSK